MNKSLSIAFLFCFLLFLCNTDNSDTADTCDEGFSCYFSEQQYCLEYDIVDQYNDQSCSERKQNCETSGGEYLESKCPTTDKLAAYCSEHDDCYIPFVYFYTGFESEEQTEMEEFCWDLDVCYSVDSFE